MSRILWLATADARGHLMRCQLLVHGLRQAGHEVDVLTTSRPGQAFLAAFGVGAELLSEHYRVEFDERQNMVRRGTEWRMFRYLTSPRRLARDLAWLSQRAEGAQLLVNDSFHPALLVGPRFRALAPLPPIVHVYGENLRPAMEGNFDGRWPGPLNRIYRAFMKDCADRATARIQHSLAARLEVTEPSPRCYQVPPVLGSPTRSPPETRRALGVAAGERLAVAYLNPHFRDPAVAQAIERAGADAGFRLHAVGEGYAGRAGWLPWDVHLVDAIAAADVLISTPGMGALGLALALGTPLAALMTDQPEQRSNAAVLDERRHPHRRLEVGEPQLAPRLEQALRALAPKADSPTRTRTPRSSVDLWVGLIGRLAEDTAPDRATLPGKAKIVGRAA